MLIFFFNENLGICPTSPWLVQEVIPDSTSLFIFLMNLMFNLNHTTLLIRKLGKLLHFFTRDCW